MSRPLRCAIYTRKSSEEGLEQSFNSLHAQREACEAYILSQRHEGWHVVREAYDDGGFSGGSMERPALKKLQAVPSTPGVLCTACCRTTCIWERSTIRARIIQVSSLP